MSKREQPARDPREVRRTINVWSWRYSDRWGRYWQNERTCDLGVAINCLNPLQIKEPETTFVLSPTIPDDID